ncbi:hypothetical protein JW752_05190 [Candidatus Peregrinibacteria bacterium]|nr:hypothetical protein [Candidatus Peregrinibacteria bacterium]
MKGSRIVLLFGLSVLCFMAAWFFLRVSEKPFTYKVLTPDAAVMAVLSDPLKFVGATDEDGDILNDAFYAGPTCVWRNRHALVISHCCWKESYTFDTEIFTPKGEMFVFYVEASGSLDYDDIADIRASKYEVFNAFLYELSSEDRQSFHLDMTMDELRDFYPADTYGPFLESDGGVPGGYWQYTASELCQACLAGTQCDRNGERIAGIWKPAAERFIKKPPKEWYLFLKLMRELAKKHGLNR